jgi:hypothetical protein
MEFYMNLVNNNFINPIGNILGGPIVQPVLGGFLFAWGLTLVYDPTFAEKTFHRWLGRFEKVYDYATSYFVEKRFETDWVPLKLVSSRSIPSAYDAWVKAAKEEGSLGSMQRLEETWKDGLGHVTRQGRDLIRSAFQSAITFRVPELKQKALKGDAYAIRDLVEARQMRAIDLSDDELSSLKEGCTKARQEGCRKDLLEENENVPESKIIRECEISC